MHLKTKRSFSVVIFTATILYIFSFLTVSAEDYVFSSTDNSESILDYDIQELEDYNTEIFDLVNRYRVEYSSENDCSELIWSDYHAEESKDLVFQNIVNDDTWSGKFQYFTSRMVGITPKEVVSELTLLNLNDSVLLNEDIKYVGVYSCSYIDDYTLIEHQAIAISFGKSENETATNNNLDSNIPIVPIVIVSAIGILVIVVTVYALKKRGKNNGTDSGQDTEQY